jgi:glutamate synthase (NADPH/NADH) large chain
MRGEFPPEVDQYEVVSRYIKAIGKGILKVMSKMGISTYQSYCGAQIFDAVGLSSAFVNSISPARYHDRRRRAEEVAAETVERHASGLLQRSGACQRAGSRRRICLPHARRGSCLDARCVATLQHAVRGNCRKIPRIRRAGEPSDRG